MVSSMKRVFSIALIVSIATIAILGGFAMDHASESGHVGCLSAAAPMPACPVSDSVAMFLFHAGILKSLLLAVANGYAALALLSLSLLFVFTPLLMRERAGPFYAYQQSTPLFLEKLSFSVAPFMRWIALRENSPSFA